MTTTQPTTLRSLAGATAPPLLVHGSALIVIDAQREYSTAGALPLHGFDQALANIERLQAAARSEDVPVIHVAHVGASGGLFDPSANGQLVDATGPESGELVVQKRLPNSFAGTELHDALGDAGVSTLVLAGFMTHMCVSSTARAALDLGYATTVVADACATRPLPVPESTEIVAADDLHRCALVALADRFSNVVSTATVLNA